MVTVVVHPTENFGFDCFTAGYSSKMGTESRIEKENPLPVLNPAQYPPNLSKPYSQRETDTVDVSK